MGGGSRLDVRLNIVSLCRVCHTSHHYGKSPTKDELIREIAVREGITAETWQEAIWALDRAAKGSDPEQVIKRGDREQE